MPRYRGRHRAPNLADTVVDNSGRIAATLVTAGVVATIPVATASPALAAAPDDVRNAIIDCESDGNPRAQNRTSTASGLYQFINGTWKAYGGSTTRARDASVSEQNRVFERAFAAEGTRPWNASKACWSQKVGEVSGKRASGEVKEPTSTGKRRTEASRGTAIPDGYTVKSGDTLGKLAQRFNVEGGYRAIAQANGIDNPDRIFVGQRLR